MTSKNLFFKYMKENTKQRLWSIALMSVMCFFLFPVMTALEVGISFGNNMIDRFSTANDMTIAKQQLTENMLNWYSIENSGLVFIFILAAVVLAASGFSYIHSKKKTDFYHSIPISRGMLYTVTCLNGILYFAVPYLVFLVIAGIILRIKAAPFAWEILMVSYGEHLCFFILVYMTAVIAMLITGNTIVGLLGTGVLFFWGPAAGAVITAYFSEFFTTFYDDGNFLIKWYERSSPVFWYITAIISKHPSRMAVEALIAAFVLFGLGMFIYRKRSSESAGRAMAFPVTEPIIRFLLVIPITLLIGIMFRSTMYDDAWTVFGLICGLLISSCLIEIIYNFDFKSLFKHKKQLLFSAVAVAAVFLGFRFNITGYDSYIPDADDIEYAGIYCDSLDGDALWMYHSVTEISENGNSVRFYWSSTANLADKIHISDEEGIHTLREIAQYAVDGCVGNQYWTDDEWNEEINYDTILLSWHLKNGKTVYRNYTSVDVNTIQPQLDLIYDNESYKLGMYPVLSLKSDDVAEIYYKRPDDVSDDKSQIQNNDYENTDINTDVYDEYGEPKPKHLDLSDEKAKAEFLQTYQKELMALTEKERRDQTPVARIKFQTVEMKEMIDTIRKNGGNYSDFDQYDYYPVYPSFVKTLETLND